MRAVILSALALLSIAPAAHADASPPPFTYISREVILEFAEPYQGWTFFAVSGNTVRRLSATAPIALSRLLGGNYAPRRMSVELYAIPDGLLDELERPTTDAKWFREQRDNPRIRQGGVGASSIPTVIADPRERVIETYRFTLTPTSLESELVSSRAEYGSGSLVCGVCLVLVVGLISLVVWLIGRLFRRKSITRTTPPPGN